MCPRTRSDPRSQRFSGLLDTGRLLCGSWDTDPSTGPVRRRKRALFACCARTQAVPYRRGRLRPLIAVFARTLDRPRFVDGVAKGWITHLHQLQVVLYHRGQLDTQPRKLMPERQQPPALAPRMQTVAEKWLAARRLTDAPATVDKLELALRTFAAWLQENHPKITTFAEVTREHCLDWIAHLATAPTARTGKPLGVMSRIQRISGLSQFFRDTALWQYPGVPGHTLIGAGDAPKYPQKVPRFIPEHELEQLMPVIDAIASRFSAPRCWWPAGQARDATRSAACRWTAWTATPTARRDCASRAARPTRTCESNCAYGNALRLSPSPFGRELGALRACGGGSPTARPRAAPPLRHHPWGPALAGRRVRRRSGTLVLQTARNEWGEGRVCSARRADGDKYKPLDLARLLSEVRAGHAVASLPDDWRGLRPPRSRRSAASRSTTAARRSCPCSPRGPDAAPRYAAASCLRARAHQARARASAARPTRSRPRESLCSPQLPD